MHDEQNDGGDGHFTRVRLDRVLSDLRHLDASHEPARVLAGLAQICVPEVRDECLIEVTEQGMNRYRIRRTGPGLVSIASGNEGSLLECAAAALPGEQADPFGVMTDDAGPTLPVGHRIAAASGILMALYHLSPTQARQLLTRASEHNSRSLGDVADTVLRTGHCRHPALPPPRGPGDRPIRWNPTAAQRPVRDPGDGGCTASCRCRKRATSVSSGMEMLWPIPGYVCSSRAE